MSENDVYSFSTQEAYINRLFYYVWSSLVSLSDFDITGFLPVRFR